MSYLDQLFNLKGKVIVITGGAGVLATSMSEALAQAGCHVVLLDRQKDRAVRQADKLSHTGRAALGLEADVLSESALNQARDQVLERFGRVDGLINAAGGNMQGATIGQDQTFFDLKLDELRKVMDLNFIGSVLPAMVFGQDMARQQSGVILNISSMAAMQAVSRVMGYAASKAGISNFTRWLATEMATKFGDGIRVNAIAPGFFIGEQNRRLLMEEDGGYTERGKDVIRKTPMRRFGQSDELAGAVLYLLSDAARFVTGVILPVDGGFSSFSGV